MKEQMFQKLLSDLYTDRMLYKKKRYKKNIIFSEKLLQKIKQENRIKKINRLLNENKRTIDN